MNIEDYLAQVFPSSAGHKDSSQGEHQQLTEEDSNRPGAVGWTFTSTTFFVAFGAVPCLVMRGFPLPCEAFKAELNKRVAAKSDDAKEEEDRTAGLVVGVKEQENLGSLWAKSTLGALIKPELTMQEVDLFRQVCDEVSVSHLATTTPPQVHVERLSLVHYGDRALVNRKDVKTFPLPLNDKVDEDAQVSTTMLAKTKEVTRAFLSRDKDREFNPYVTENCLKAPAVADHYLAPSDGRTLVCDCFPPTTSSKNLEAQQMVAEFRSKIDAALPGKFQWFPDSALHITIRGL